MKSPLLRNVLSAVSGYVVMFAVAFVLFSLMWAVLGAEGSFAAGTWDVSGGWIVASMVFGLIVSISGGYSCSTMAASSQGVMILIGLVMVVAVLSGLPDADAVASAGLRPEGITMFDAMSTARQPTWLLWLNPAVGVIGVLLGARLESGREAIGA